MKIAWIADFTIATYKAGGAQYTNEMFIKAGEKRNHAIDIITPDKILYMKDYDLYLMHNIRNFNTDFITYIIENKPYIRMEHDYWVCGAYKNNKRFTSILDNSLLNLFMSKRHIKENEKCLGFNIPRANYVVGPVDTDMFKIDKRIKKDNSMVIWIGHDVCENKGFDTAILYAKEHPGFNFKMFGIFKKATNENTPKNVEIIGEVDQKDLIEYLKKAQYLMAVPNWVEPSGRSVLEGLLCGCDLIVNDNIGLLSEDIDFNHYDEIVKLAHSEDKFWDLVEGSMK